MVTSVLINVSLAWLAVVITLYVMRWNLIRRPSTLYSPTPLVVIEALIAASMVFWILSAMYLVRHPLAWTALAFLGISLWRGGIEMRRRRRASVNRWIRFHLCHGGSIETAIDSIVRSGGGNHRLIRLATLRSRGVAMEHALQIAGGELEPETIAMIDRGEPNRSRNDPSPPTGQRIESTSMRIEDPTFELWSPGHLAVYAVLMLLGLVMVRLLIDSSLYPILREMIDEFSLSGATSIKTFDAMLVTAQSIAPLVWLLLALLIAWVVASWVIEMGSSHTLSYLVPWTGRSLRDRRRADWLESTGRGIERGESLAVLCRRSAGGHRDPWVRGRCRSAAKRLEAGFPVDAALGKSRLILPHERRWIAASVTTQRLSAAMQTLAGDVRRGDRRRWDNRRRWLLPTMLAFFAWVVYLDVRLLFQFMAALNSTAFA